MYRIPIWTIYLFAQLAMSNFVFVANTKSQLYKKNNIIAEIRNSTFVQWIYGFVNEKPKNWNQMTKTKSFIELMFMLKCKTQNFGINALNILRFGFHCTDAMLQSTIG